jgi:hypothetical protein
MKGSCPTVNQVSQLKKMKGGEVDPGMIEN